MTGNCRPEAEQLIASADERRQATSDQTQATWGGGSSDAEDVGAGRSGRPGCRSRHRRRGRHCPVRSKRPRPQPEPPANTVKVEKRTLSAMVSVDGTLTYRAAPDGSPYSVINQASGTYTELPVPGQVISQGQVLYRVNDSPVVLLYGSTPAYRTLSAGATGADVAELNADLVALGYATSAQLSPTSASFGSATTTALEKLQAALGVTQNGTLTLGQAVFEPTAVRVTTLSAPLGGSTQTGQTVMQATSTTRQVQVALDASQQTDVAVGDKVTITLPNNQTTPGVVSSVGTVATCPSSSGVRRVELQLRCAGNGHLLVGQLGEQHHTDHHRGRHPLRPGRHGHLGSGPGAGHHHHRQRAQRPGGASDRAAGPVRRWLRRRGRRRRGDQPSGAGLARTVRRRRRAGAGHRLGAGRRPTSGGPGHMTNTPPHHARPPIGRGRQRLRY